MTWNYRIVRSRAGHFTLHEVYYDENGAAWGMTEEPVTFACGADEPPSVIVDALQMALKDAINLPVFDEPEHWPGDAP